MIETAIGIAIFLVVGIPVLSFVLTMVVSFFILQVSLLVAIGGYFVGIPWAIYRRLSDGEWPQ